jgi:hypothetical protein
VYDLFLYEGCRSRPDLSELADTLPILRTEAFLERVTSPFPGFLELSLEKEVVLQLARALKSSGKLGLYLLEGYRTPTISEAFALEVGERERAKLIAESPELTFYPPRVNPRKLIWWEVTIGCKEWSDAGVLPGAIILWVDKLDGHVWDDQEMDEFLRDQPLTRIK